MTQEQKENFIKGFIAAWYAIGVIEKRYLSDVTPQQHADYDSVYHRALEISNKKST